MRKAETHYQVLHVIMKRSLKSQEGLISECVTELAVKEDSREEQHCSQQ